MNLYKTFIIICLCVPIAAFANPIDKYKKSKKINKTYSVNSDALVDIENSFGDVTVVLWDQNTVSIDVTVEVSGNDEESVNNRLEMIDVDFKSSQSKVSATSDIPSERNGIMGWFTGKGNTSTNVDFMIKMPRNSPLDIENDYGAVIIDQMNAPLKLSCDFGRLQIGQLLNVTNELSFDYTENSHIDYFKGGVIKADFSKFTVHGADVMDFSGDYTTAIFGPLKNIKYNSDFSTIKLEDAMNIDGRGDYSTVKIESFENDAVLKADFGSITIEQLKKDFRSLNIKSDYTTIKLGYDHNASFTYDCQTEFGSLKLDNHLTTVNSRKEMNESSKEGYYSDQNASSKIEINSSFGSVSLKSN